MATMLAARLHEVGTAFSIDRVEKPTPRPTDVVVRVKACGIIPNMKNVMSHWKEWYPYLPLPPFPAIFGLDAAGEVTEVGARVRDIVVGDRVYVNPGIGCGACSACRTGEFTNCEAYTFLGYFGFGEGSSTVFDEYPYAGFAQYMTAPVSSLVKLPPAVSYEEAARFGYLGTAYSGLLKSGARAGKSVLISGATGTLGVGAVVLALAMGCTQLFCIARNRSLLERLQSIDPRRIRILSVGDRPIADWVKEHTGGLGVDIFLDAIGPGAPAAVTLDGLASLRRGGRMVDIGQISEPLPIDMNRLMCSQNSVIGSLWFSLAEGQDMAAMCAAGTLDLSVFEHERFPLEKINDALSAVDQRRGGFTNVVVVHE